MNKNIPPPLACKKLFGHTAASSADIRKSRVLISFTARVVFLKGR